MQTVTRRLHVVNVGGVALACGLQWKSYERTSKDAIKGERLRIAKASSTEPAMQYNAAATWFLRKGDKGENAKAQGGFAVQPRRSRDPIYSLAAILASEFGKAWLGAFELPGDLYAVIGVGPDGLIMPVLDEVLPREEAERVLKQHVSGTSRTSAWTEAQQKVFAPEHFNVPGREVRLDKVIRAKSSRAWKDFQLQPLRSYSSRLPVYLLCGGAVLLLALVSAYTWHKKRLEDEALALQQQRDADALAEAKRKEQAQAAARKVVDLPRFVEPWLSAPRTADVVALCQSLEDAQWLSVGGWILTGTECNASMGMRGDYVQDDAVPATVADFVGGSLEAYGRMPQEIENGRSGRTSMPPPEALVAGGDIALGDYLKEVVKLTSLLQELMPVAVDSYAIAEMPTVLTDEQRKAGAEPPPWRTASVQIQSSIPPSMLIEGGLYAGFYVKSIKTAVSAGNGEVKWTITGELYAR